MKSYEKIVNNGDSSGKVTDQKINIMPFVEQIVSQYTLGYYNSEYNTKGITLTEYTYLYVLIVFVLGNVETEMNHNVNWRKIIKIIIYDYLIFGCFPGLNCNHINDILQQNSIYKKLILEKWACLGDEIIRELEKYLLFGCKEEICDTAKIYANILLNNEEGMTQADYDELYEHIHIRGLQKLLCKQPEYFSIQKASKLNSVIRWGHKKGILSISVAAHSVGVAILTILLLLSNNKYNDSDIHDIFFAALFHDIYEISTGDIISPVKSLFKTHDVKWRYFERSAFIKDWGSLCEIYCGKQIIKLASLAEDYSRKDSMEAFKLIKFIDKLSSYYEGKLFIIKDNDVDFESANMIFKDYIDIDSLGGVYIKDVIDKILQEI